MPLKCMRVNCDENAGYSLRLLVPPRVRLDDHAYELYCGLRLCRACANSVSVDDLLDSKARKSMTKSFQRSGFGTPDFDNVELMIISMNDMTLLTLEAQNQTIH